MNVMTPAVRAFAKRGVRPFLLLIAATIVTSVVMELTIRRENVSFRLLEAFADPVNQPEILILGDSRAALDVKASIIGERVFNWAEVGEGLRQTSLKVAYALVAKPSVRYNVLPIDDYIFSEYRAADQNYRLQAGYADPAIVHRHFNTTRARILRHQLAWAAPILDHEWRLQFVDSVVHDIEDALGLDPEPPFTQLDPCLDLHFTNEVDWAGQPDELRSQRTNRRKEIQFPDEMVVPQMVDIFDWMINAAAARGVSVVGVRYPISNEYIQSKGDLDKAPIRRAVSSIPLSNQLDFQAQFAYRQELFNDMDHLRQSGAVEFTQLLAAALVAVTGVPLPSDAACERWSGSGRLVPALSVFLGIDYRFPL